jgi:hypothetical protein
MMIITKVNFLSISQISYQYICLESVISVIIYNLFFVQLYAKKKFSELDTIKNYKSQIIFYVTKIYSLIVKIYY